MNKKKLVNIIDRFPMGARFMQVQRLCCYVSIGKSLFLLQLVIFD